MKKPDPMIVTVFTPQEFAYWFPSAKIKPRLNVVMMRSMSKKGSYSAIAIRVDTNEWDVYEIEQLPIDMKNQEAFYFIKDEEVFDKYETTLEGLIVSHS